MPIITFLTYNGVTKTRKQWAKQYKIPLEILSIRIRNGWDIKEALETPNYSHRKRDHMATYKQGKELKEGFVWDCVNTI